MCVANEYAKDRSGNESDNNFYTKLRTQTNKIHTKIHCVYALSNAHKLNKLRNKLFYTRCLPRSLFLILLLHSALINGVNWIWIFHVSIHAPSKICSQKCLFQSHIQFQFKALIDSYQIKRPEISYWWKQIEFEESMNSTFTEVDGTYNITTERRYIFNW